MKDKMRALALRVGAPIAAFGSMIAAKATHAQVTFSATESQAALVSAVDGVQTFLWDNLPGVLLIIASIVIALSLFYRVLRAARRG